MSRLLLHTCCAPCTIHPLRQLRAEGFEVEGRYYNPNIHPYLEWVKRRDTLRQYAESVGLPIEFVEGYDLGDFLRRTAPCEEDRCSECYDIRLTDAARAARSGGYDAFSTTLLVSPYQRHEVIRAKGEGLAEEYGVPFIYRDFRPGFRGAQDEARSLGLYRQPYCGCIFSERDRYQKTRKGEGGVTGGRL